MICKNMFSGIFGCVKLSKKVFNQKSAFFSLTKIHVSETPESEPPEGEDEFFSGEEALDDVDVEDIQGFEDGVFEEAPPDFE
jgi:hypothetical protein